MKKNTLKVNNNINKIMTLHSTLMKTTYDDHLEYIQEHPPHKAVILTVDAEPLNIITSNVSKLTSPNKIIVSEHCLHMIIYAIVADLNPVKYFRNELYNLEESLKVENKKAKFKLISLEDVDMDVIDMEANEISDAILSQMKFMKSTDKYVAFLGWSNKATRMNFFIS